MKKVLAIIGARPQFIKHFPLELAAKNKVDLLTLHTGQHYDENMSNVFFNQLGMSEPNFQLNIGSGTHGVQTAKMIIEIESVCLREKPDGMLVYGDTNSTLAGAIVSSKLHIPLFHVEAGLRSYNKSMPEEVNRIMTDHVSSLLFIPSEVSKSNLLKEGIESGVHMVGDIMKDIVQYVSINNLGQNPEVEAPYIYATLHRPYNVDIKERLKSILTELNLLPEKVIFSRHPRTKNKMETLQLNDEDYPNIVFIEPQGYLENMGYLMNCSRLITDSGGMQKEAYWLKKQCITIRSETEWVETLEQDANTLVFDDLSTIKDLFKLSPTWSNSLYGDGNASEQIINTINDYLS